MMTFVFRCTRKGAVALGAALWLSAAHGFAQSTPPEKPSHADVAAAQALFDAGMRAAQAGRYAEACPKFEESQRLDPALGTEFQLGNCYEKTGRIASAWSLFRDVEGKARLRGQQDRIDVAKGRADALEPRLPRLKIDVPTEASKLNGLEIKRDGVSVGRGQWGVGVPVDTGDHVIVVTATAKKPVEKRVRAVEGQVAALSIPSLEDADAAAESTAPRGSSTSSRGSTQRLIALATVGAGVVGLGVGTGLGFAAKSKWNESNDRGECDATGCSDIGLETRDDARSTAMIGTVVFGVGAAALAAGAILYFTAPKEPKSVAVAPVFGPGGGGVGVHGRW